MPAITRFTLRKLDSLLKGRMEERKERCPVSRDYAGSTVKGVQMNKCHKCVWYRAETVWTLGRGSWYTTDTSRTMRQTSRSPASGRTYLQMYQPYSSDRDQSTKNIQQLT